VFKTTTTSIGEIRQTSIKEMQLAMYDQYLSLAEPNHKYPWS
jgi:hypothetical protein